MNCGGDSTQKCGDSWTMNVYSKIGTSTQWTSAGCYIDANSRILRGSNNRLDTMTTETCIAMCTSGGYPMAATEDGKECWCGSQFFREGSAGGVAGAGQCSTPCGGTFIDNSSSFLIGLMIIWNSQATLRKPVVVDGVPIFISNPEQQFNFDQCIFFQFRSYFYSNQTYISSSSTWNRVSDKLTINPNPIRGFDRFIRVYLSLLHIHNGFLSTAIHPPIHRSPPRTHRPHLECCMESRPVVGDDVFRG